MKPGIVYLHGFASGPGGHKGRHCRAWAEARRISFHAPDLNPPDFEHLRITAQVEAVEAILRGLPLPPVIVGSSLGGLVAAAVAGRGTAVAQLILLAPAFGFARRRLSGPRWSGYRRRGTLKVYHHAREAWLQLGPDLLEDLPRWKDDLAWRIEAPTVILHGAEDDAVPIVESRAFAAAHPSCVLRELEDDHALLKPGTLAVLDGLLEDAFRPTRG